MKNEGVYRSVKGLAAKNKELGVKYYNITIIYVLNKHYESAS